MIIAVDVAELVWCEMVDQSLEHGWVKTTDLLRVG